MSRINKLIKKIKTEGLFKTIDLVFNILVFETKKRMKINTKDYKKIAIKSSDKLNVVEKSGTNVFIFAGIPYYDIGGGQRSSQLAKTFNRMGYRVYYIYSYKSSEKHTFKLENPNVLHKYIGSINVNDIAAVMTSQDLCIFETPTIKIKDYLNLAKQKKAQIIYENIDNWETSLGESFLNRNILKDLITNANCLVGTAKPLVKQLNKYIKEYQQKDRDNIIYLPNAVDDGIFNPLIKCDQPSDLKIGKKTFLYYGSLWGEWFDWNLIEAIAKADSDYTVNLIGDYHNIKNIMVRMPKNVYFLGLKPQTLLPNYLKYADVALLPFKVDKIGEYVSPLKIFEYIAMQKPVISTSLPDIQGYPGVHFGDDEISWRRLAIDNLEVNELTNEQFTLNNNWYSRCQKMIDLTNLSSDQCDPLFYKNISVILLNYNNKNIISKTLRLIERYQKRYQYEIIVVDNQSTDGSPEIIKKDFSNVKLIYNNKNGCSSGRNLGIKATKKEYIMFLDSDQWPLHDYWLDPHLTILQNKEIGAVGWAAGWFNNYGLAYRTVDHFPYRAVMPNIFYRQDIGYLGSGGLLVAKKTLELINGFDETYDPTCYEDTDLSVAIRNAGKKIVYSPYLGIYHLPHQTTKSGSDSHLKLIKKNGAYFVKKWQSKNPKLLKYKK